MVRINFKHVEKGVDLLLCFCILTPPLLQKSEGELQPQLPYSFKVNLLFLKTGFFVLTFNISFLKLD